MQPGPLINLGEPLTSSDLIQTGVDELAL